MRSSTGILPLRGYHPATSMAGRLLILSLLVLTVTSCGHALPKGVTSYDVDAARLCQAVEVFVNDAKAGTDSVTASNSLDAAESRVRANPGPGQKWLFLANDVTTFLNDAQTSQGIINFAGLQIGKDCSRVPVGADKVTGFN
jgi:hypothetical protein